MRRHHLLSLLLLALAAASLLLLLQAEVEAGAEGSANYRHFMATLAASNTSNLGQCSIPPLEVVYNDLAYRKAFWPKMAARCKHEQPRLTYMEVLHTKYFFPFKKYFSSRYIQIFPGRHVPVEPQCAGQPQPPTVLRGQLRVAGVRQ